jgi:hypothetical protein
LFSLYGQLHGEPIETRHSRTIGSGLTVLDLAVCIHEQCLGSLEENIHFSKIIIIKRIQFIAEEEIGNN